MISNNDRYWQGSYNVPGTILGTEATEENKIVPTLKELTL